MKNLTRLKCLSSLILALAAALSLTACSADTASGVFPELSQIVGEIIQTAEESSPVTREFFQTQEPEEQSAEPERPDVPLTSGEGQEGFPQTDEESVQPDAPTENSPVTREFFQTQEPEEQSAEPERPDVPQTPGEGQVGFPQTDEESAQPDAPPESSIAEDGSYTTKEDVALYIHTYGKLPQNFITKKQARELGWGGGSLEPYAPGMCIGGDRFGNYEGLLPEGHSYTECDVNTLGASSRGAERIIFSSDGLIYYTGDHYASFTLLYGEE
jgi:guanyl-specific ribonuclease Sa